MKEVRFLEVVVGPDGIKIEEEKVKEVLDEGSVRLANSSRSQGYTKVPRTG